MFYAMASSSAVRLMRLMSEGSDFDIFMLPSRRLMTRAVSFGMMGSGKVKSSTTKSVLNLIATSRQRSEEHTSELQSLMRNSYAVICLQNNQHRLNTQITHCNNSTRRAKSST